MRTPQCTRHRCGACSALLLDRPCCACHVPCVVRCHAPRLPRCHITIRVVCLLSGLTSGVLLAASVLLLCCFGLCVSRTSAKAVVVLGVEPQTHHSFHLVTRFWQVLQVTLCHWEVAGTGRVCCNAHRRSVRPPRGYTAGHAMCCPCSAFVTPRQCSDGGILC